MSHNEDFIKTAIPEELWDSAKISAEGKPFVGIGSFLKHLSDDNYVVKITSTSLVDVFICEVVKLPHVTNHLQNPKQVA
ncbi:hypothetical protein [Serratia entomophila]|uniref:hypothetical protein n=1 Tax=Serratia entomophila TaxID=42906 RepID=UPI0021BD901C|nr:hypothetical protein [Serratia entomophila]